jgi:hypothetical protein
LESREWRVVKKVIRRLGNSVKEFEGDRPGGKRGDGIDVV